MQTNPFTNRRPRAAGQAQPANPFGNTNGILDGTQLPSSSNGAFDNLFGGGNQPSSADQAANRAAAANIETMRTAASITQSVLGATATIAAAAITADSANTRAQIAADTQRALAVLGQSAIGLDPNSAAYANNQALQMALLQSQQRLTPADDGSTLVYWGVGLTLLAALGIGGLMLYKHEQATSGHVPPHHAMAAPYGHHGVRVNPVVGRRGHRHWVSSR